MSRIETLAEGVTLYAGDCLQVLPTLAENSIDSCVCDPPYHLTSIVKRFGKTNKQDPTKTSERARAGADGMARMSRGFMGKVWDGGEVAFEPETWAAVLRVLKPGGHLLAFGAPKNFGFMQYAIAQGGFEVRDVIAWLFGSGFPKSHNIGNGWGTAFKPAFEPVIVARKPLSESTIAANVLKWGTGALNIDGCRVATDETITATRNYLGGAIEPGGMEKNGCRVFTRYEQNQSGRWPANVIHDGSEEVVAAFPHTASGTIEPHHASNGASQIGTFNIRDRSGEIRPTYGDEGSAARFFYTAKADQDDRLGSKHPTVKPLDLMQYLVRLVTPKNGVVLDPFAGTGTTGEAAFREGFRAVLIEREPEYQADIQRRMGLALSGPETRARAAIKERMKDKPVDHGPLFEARPYDSTDDVSKCFEHAYQAMRERGT